MCEAFLPEEEDGLKAALWGLFVSWVLEEGMGLALAGLPTQEKSC